MNIEWVDNDFCLTEGKPLRVTGASGVRVYCTSGCIWITTAGNSEDIFLHGGEQHQIESATLTLVESIGPAKIRLELPDRARYVTRCWRLLNNGLSEIIRNTAARISRTGRVASGRDFPA